MAPTRIFFDVSTGPNAKTLWSTDGTAAGTKEVGTFSFDSDFEPIAITNFSPLGGKAYFLDADGNPYVTDGTAAGTFKADEAGGTWSDLASVDGSLLYFKGGALWSSNGTTATKLATLSE